MDSSGSPAGQRMTTSGAERKFRHGSLPEAIRGIPENICSSRAFLTLTHCRSHTPFKIPLSIVATNARILTQVLEGGPLPWFVILVLDSAPFLKPAHHI